MFRCVKISATILALSGLETQCEGEVVIRVPQLVRHEAQAGIQIAQRCFMGGRGLGSLAGAQVEPCEGDALRSVRDEAAPEIQMMNDVEDPLLELGGGTMR